MIEDNTQKKNSVAIKALGEFVRNAREKQGLSTRDLAKLSGISHSRISKFETNEQSNMGIERVLLLANALNINITPYF